MLKVVKNALSKMEVIDNPDTYENAMTLRLEPNCTSGNDVLSVSNLAKSFDNNHYFPIFLLKLREVNVLLLSVITEPEKIYNF